MAKKQSRTPDPFDLLTGAVKVEPAPVAAIVGEPGFLQHEVRLALIAGVSGATSDDDAVADVLDGPLVELRDVLDALRERSLFGDGRRIVVVAEADGLVKDRRADLEAYVAKPSPDAVLILEVASWPATTKLAKAVAKSGVTVCCQLPSKRHEQTAFNNGLKKWLAAIAKREFQCELAAPAAGQLLELLPSEPGVLYQEVARLALLTGADRKLDAALIRAHVGGWRARQTWDMIDAAADGRAADALMQLDRLLSAGERPHGIMPQLLSSLRKFALAVRLFEQAERSGSRMSLRDALQRSGIPPFKLPDAERQLKQISRPRARQLYRWLLAADLDSKGYNSADDRARRVIETLILRLSKEVAATA
jgi:DNA polymerase-3 subunit delta